MQGKEVEVVTERDEQHIAERVVDGEMTVVVMCSRCPAEQAIGATGQTQPWNVVLVDTGRSMQHKVLCNACASELQTWFLSPGAR